MDRRLEIPPLVECVNCHTDINVDDNRIPAAYFRGILQSCPKCASPFDWWDVMLSATLHPMPFGQQLAPVGGRLTILRITLLPNQIFTLRFADHGIPANARIILVNYTPDDSGLFPLEIHGNTPRRHGIPSEIQLYPRPVGSGPHRDTPVNVLVAWLPEDEYNVSWQNLTSAFEAYHAGRLDEAVLPANVAVELRVNQLFSDLLTRSARRDRVEQLLIHDAGYSRQLNVLLPAFLSFTDAPPLSDEIRGKLNRLNELRHDIAHRGHLVSTPTKEQMAELLCAALFGYRYLQVVEPFLLR